VKRQAVKCLLLPMISHRAAHDRQATGLCLQ
jgi:hypothetical protein